MKENVSDYLIKRLSQWGINRIFGYPGDGINGIMGALNRAEGKITFIQTRHEETAALMACAHAKFTGEVGVCLATSGPGAIHLLNGLYDAKLDHQPVVAIVGQKSRMSLGGHFQQEVDLVSLFKDVASDFVQMATDPKQIRHLIDRAFRIAKLQRTVTCVIVPSDLQSLEAQEPPHENGSIHSGIGHPAPRILPQSSDLQKAAQLLNAGERVAMLVGAGALHAAKEVIQVADILGAGVAKAFLGKAVLPDSLPYVTGAIGLFGTEVSHQMMRDCDTLLMIGSGFPYSEFLPEEGQAKGIQIDIDGRMLSIRYPMNVNLMGDSAETLQALLPYLQPKEDRTWRNTIEQNVKNWWDSVHAQALQDANPLNPRLVFEDLSPRLPDNCILTADSGSVSSWVAQHIRIRSGMQFSVSGTLATMGCSIPYALAAKFAHPDRPVIAFAGDGAMQMSGNAELLTIKKYQHLWPDQRFIVVVLNNHDLNFVTWEQRLIQGEPRFEASQQVPDFNYAQYAQSLGFTGIRVNAPGQVADAWEQAFQATHPVLLEAITDPEVAVFSPQIVSNHAKKLASAIQQGDTAAAQHLDPMVQNAVQQASSD